MPATPRYIYVESAVADHPRARRMIERLPRARVVPCRRYGEIFNRRAQDFRLQKRHPAWILAEKTAGWVLSAPEEYGLGGEENYYFSHMLNCFYDCGYCFLQGMFRSAHYLCFVNYEDFMTAIDQRLEESSAERLWFFSGYDCDSLAAEEVTGFATAFLPFFAARPRAWLELRTKSVQIEALLASEPYENCVVAFSFTPAEVHADLEHGVPSVERRLRAMVRLRERGWQIGLRFDPLIWSRDYRQRYERLCEQVFGQLEGTQVHSVSLGSFRLPKAFYSRMTRMLPGDRLLAGPLTETDGLVGYRPELEAEMLEAVGELLLARVPGSRLHLCQPVESQVSAITSGK